MSATRGAAERGALLGGALVSLLEPVRGQEVAFNRWYERDHFYAGVLAGPGFFSGRRFVATRALKALRYPERTPVVDDIREGSYLSLYWILKGQEDQAIDWAVARVNQLRALGRLRPAQGQAQAGFYAYRGGAFRDADGVPAELALDHPFGGAVLLMVDRGDGVEAAELERFYREKRLPKLLAGSPAAMCLFLQPQPLPAGAPASVRRPPGIERRILLLYFLETDPHESWSLFAAEGEAIAATGLGAVSYAAPFVPTVPGSDRYADELW